MRDASHKDLNLPASLLRTVDDLLTDFIDVSLPSNSEIVCKCVSILKTVAEFVHTERKKDEAKSVKIELKGADEANEEVKED